jgi:hypothetical protein
MIYNNPKFEKNADLIPLFIACPFAKPAESCPFSCFHFLKDESAQVQQILFVPQHRLNEMREIHQNCFKRLLREQQVMKSADWEKTIVASRLAIE